LNWQSFVTNIFQFRFPTFPAMKHSIVFVVFLLTTVHGRPDDCHSAAPSCRSPGTNEPRPSLSPASARTPDSRKDATAAFQRAIDACKRLANPVLIIPHGRYDLYPDSAIKKTYFISNTSSETECPSKVKTIGLLFETSETSG
jgi:hypothetical protein